MEYKEIKQLIHDIEDSKLQEFNIELPDGTKIGMKKDIKNVVEYNNVVPQKSNNINVQTINNEEKNSQVEETKDVKVIKSPMVGTFYIKPSPTSEPYVEIGSKVKKGQTVCIIEAMKLMNEIESEFDGEIVEIYIKDGQMVEYGTELFRIK